MSTQCIGRVMHLLTLGLLLVFAKVWYLLLFDFLMRLSSVSKSMDLLRVPKIAQNSIHLIIATAMIHIILKHLLQLLNP